MGPVAKTEVEAQLVDAGVHPLVRQANDLREYMKEPYKSMPFPGPERFYYPHPIGEHHPDAKPAQGLPGSDPDLLERQLFEANGVDFAVLLPLTRGLLPDAELGNAVAAATNEWLADTWLSKYNQHGRYRGTIRVNPMTPDQAAREIEKWAGHPYFVQVAVPMQSHHPYGQRQYHPIWEAAARHNLPVAIHADGGSSVDFWPTPAGYLTHFIEYSTFYPINFAFHLVSFMAEGVFDRFEQFKVVFADGAHDMLAPIVWRMDKDWRPTRHEMPWMKHMPNHYLKDHVLFLAHKLEGPSDPAIMAEWLAINEAGNTLLFASNYPQWDFNVPKGAFVDVPADMRRRIVLENARELYKLPATRSA
ncbi:MAG: amidohydrolase family protein [Chloroflexi bacterium]|nr:amidohydrolase family protein [Chloroflexota bacterium]